MTWVVAVSGSPEARTQTEEDFAFSTRNELSIRSLEPAFQRSPFTHHLTPDSLLSFAQTLYGRAPQAILVSIRGYHFGFSQELSPETAPQAAAAELNYRPSENMYIQLQYRQLPFSYYDYYDRWYDPPFTGGN